MVTVGRIIRPHGNRGHVVVNPESDFAEERFKVGETFRVRAIGHDEADGAGESRSVTVTASRHHEGRWIVGFEGVSTIDDAETLRGQELCIPEDELRALGPNAFYVHHLVGCEVRTVAGKRVGVVNRVDLATGIPVLVVLGRGEVLVPFVDAICRRVDPAARVIEIDPPDGLIELNGARA
jgi:16S rRNA processing protein RimM